MILVGRRRRVDTITKDFKKLYLQSYMYKILETKDKTNHLRNLYTALNLGGYKEFSQTLVC